jgi:type I restriction enzyme M protein
MDKNINISKESNLLFSLADDLRGKFKAYENQDIILPFIVLRRLEINLAECRADMKTNLKDSHPLKNSTDKEFNSHPLVAKQVISKIKYNNNSGFDFRSLVSESEKNIKSNFVEYLDGFTDNIQVVMKNFDFYNNVTKLHSKKLLLNFVSRFSSEEFNFLDPKVTSNEKMGYIFEDLIRRFSEQSNETAGEHFTPREVIELMVKLLNISEINLQSWKDIKIYDPACGTGGMLTMAENYLRSELNLKNKIELFGQELNPKSYAVCYSDMLIKGENPENVKEGNTLTNDLLEDESFDFMLSNPPFGVSWKDYADEIVDSKTKEIKLSKFKIGLPRVSDGSLLFLEHMVSKMKKVDASGSRIGIVFNGSPLFSGDAGSGESEIRKYLIDNDLIECIVALPTNLFYNTSISTYVWILNNNKSEERKDKVQLINGSSFFEKMKKSLGDKRQFISEEQINELSRIHSEFDNKNKFSKVFDKTEFLFKKVSLTLFDKDESGKEIKINDSEKIPFSEDVETYLKREVELPFVIKKEVVGCEINFTRFFYEYEKLRSSCDVEKDIISLEKSSSDIMKDLGFKF